MFILHIFYKLYIDPQKCFSFKLLSFFFLCSRQNNQVNLDRSGIFLTLFLPPKTPPVVEPQYFFIYFLAGAAEVFVPLLHD